MKISLIHPHSSNPAKNNAIWPPLGLCRIATFLEQKGHEVNIIEDALQILSIDSILEQVEQSEIIGIGAMTIQSNRSLEIIKNIRLNQKSIIIAGGPHFASTAKKSLDLFDAVVIGDGEQGILDIINGNKGIINSSSLNNYIPISFKCINYLKYGDHLIDGTRAISILTSRGCPFDCKFCASPSLFGRSVTNYPLEEVVKNMIDLSNQYNIKAFRIMDDNFALNSKRVIEFCKLVKPYNFIMSCLTNAKTVRKDVLDIMYDAGFRFMALGVESGNQNILNIANKGVKKEQILKASKIINDSGVKLESLFMIGLPGETKETIKESIDFAKSLNSYRVHVQFFTPLIGSEFYNDILINGKYGKIIDHDINHYNHRIPVFIPDTITYDDFIEVSHEFFDFVKRKIGE